LEWFELLSVELEVSQFVVNQHEETDQEVLECVGDLRVAQVRVGYDLGVLHDVKMKELLV
jgi:hypothetical protein